MKTIGVLGGLGPQATMAFERQVHLEAQKRISPQFGSGYPPMVVYYCRFPPFALDDESRLLAPLTPEPRLLQAAASLGRLADFLVITANGPHEMISDIESAAGKPILSMIDIALQAVAQRDWRKVGLLSFMGPSVYLRPLAGLDIETVELDEAPQRRLDDAIRRVMEGRETGEDREAAWAAVHQLLAAGADGVILGCTEVPLLLGEIDGRDDLIDPGALLAAAAVQKAID